MEGYREKRRRARTRETDKLVHLDPDDPEARKKNLYYWWWVYLRENKGYEETCANGGRGVCAKLYRDFGNVHTTSFSAWWKENVWMLFGEPWQGTMAKRLKKQMQKVLDRGDSLDGEIWVDLKIPLHVSSHRVTRLLEGLIEREQRLLNLTTDKWNCEPKYKLAGSAQTKKLDIDLKIYRSKISGGEQDWKIGVEFGLDPSYDSNDKPIPGQPLESWQKNRLRHMVWGRRDRASGRISGAAQGDFPGKRPRSVHNEDPDSS